MEIVEASYTVILDREEDGRLIASVPGIPGCHAYGRTRAQAIRRVKSALKFYLEALLREGKKPPKQPKPVAGGESPRMLFVGNISGHCSPPHPRSPFC